MSLAALLALTVVGFAVGFLSGLVGIGGGVLMVPFLYFFYDHAVWSGVALAPALHATVAHATSLFVIVPAAVVGTVTYARNGLVAWRAALPVALFSMAAAAAGALLAVRVPAELLKFGFGAFLIFTGIQLVGSRSAVAGRPVRFSILTAALSGTLVGLLSALLGVGGGLVAIPLLIYLVRLDMSHVAATSLAIVAFAATAGTITYMVTGYAGASDAGAAVMPRGSIGFVHIAAAVPMLPGAVLAARWGARMNQRLDAGRLRLIFALLLMLFGVRLALENLIPLVRG
jgi:uncharacterized protein